MVATLRIDPELRAAIDQLAEAEDRSAAQVIRVLLREALAARESSAKGKRKREP